MNFHSGLMREIYNNESRISVPVEHESLLCLLGLLVHGKVGSSKKEVLTEVRCAANLLGIDTFFLSIVENKEAFSSDINESREHTIEKYCGEG